MKLRRTQTADGNNFTHGIHITFLHASPDASTLYYYDPFTNPAVLILDVAQWLFRPGIP
jgi:hypothetical protein